ncbi:molybdenum cofactor guanylyltransferase [Qaidamihabitans albus]|uniref:molybdenum cofactor guanylyltransferase n=1 Tax=Qaidamihabitans albus TaxID=2795733 RepID=UPI0018F26BBB|nr:NTP transferase domain-containing protein [Qaidamihabitans albus]
MDIAGGLAGVVLAGGAARRLSGLDKPMLEVGGMSLLHRAVAALRDADPVVVVGPPRPGLPGVRWTREDPPGSGPVAALAAGLGTVRADLVAVLAADLAGVTPSTVERLRAAIGTAEGAVLVDPGGHRQWLIGVWRDGPLRAALPADPVGAPLHATLGGLSIVDVPAEPGEADDVDTPGDLEGR